MSAPAVRLVAGDSKNGDAQLRAGIEIKMQPGWKTYWRYPGDSGVPPQFDFSGSENLKAAEVLYPAPHLFTDETGQSLGYKERVILPLVVSPQQPGKPVRLRLKIDYAVCEKLCVPAEGRAELTLGPGDSASQSRIDRRRGARTQAGHGRAGGTNGAPRTPADRSRWSRSMLPRPPVNLLPCLSKGRRRNGRCPSRSPQTLRRRGEPNSASNLTDCRQASIPKATSI